MFIDRDDAPDPTDVASSQSGASGRLIITRLLVSAVIGVSLYLVLRELGVDLVPSSQSLAKLHIGRVARLVLILLFSTYLRRRAGCTCFGRSSLVRTLRTIGVSLVGYAALFAPMRMGEVAQPLLAARDGRIKFFGAAGTGGRGTHLGRADADGDLGERVVPRLAAVAGAARSRHDAASLEHGRFIHAVVVAVACVAVRGDGGVLHRAPRRIASCSM